MKKKRRDDHTVPQKVHYHSHWKHHQDAVYWVKLSRAQDQGLQCNSGPVPADCICRVISQIGDRMLFERHSTPRPAPKVTLKTNCQSQQQQSVCDDVSTCTRRLVRESHPGIRDVRGYITDDQTTTRRFVRDPEPTVEQKPSFEIDLRVEGVSKNR